MAEAARHNAGKIELSRMREFGSANRKVVSVMQQGAIKYADGNWLLGGKPDKEYLDSADRHIQLFTEGEVYDQESGNHHIAHAAWNLLALLRLNYNDLPELNPDFDQDAFVKQWNEDAEEPASHLSRQEQLELDLGTRVKGHLYGEDGTMEGVIVGRDIHDNKGFIRIETDDRASYWLYDPVYLV